MQVRWPVHFGLASDLYAKMLGNRTQSSVGARQLCFLEPKFRVFMVDKVGLLTSVSREVWLDVTSSRYWANSRRLLLISKI